MHYFRKIIVLQFTFLLVFFAKANSSVYVVDNYSYTTSLKNVKKNRNNVMEKIKIKALKSFIEKVTLREDHEKIKFGKDYQKFIKSFIVKDELKSSGQKYELITKIEIDQKQIKSLLSNKKIKYVNFKSSPLLTVIVEKKGNKLNLITDELIKNKWLEGSENDLLNYFFLNEDLNDLQAINKLDANFYQIAKLDKVISNYGVRDFAFLVIDHDALEKENIFLRYQFNELKFTTKKRVKKLQNLNFKDEFLDLKKLLNYSWKEIQILSPKKENIITFKYNHKNLKDLLILKKKIKENSIISTLRDIQVTSEEYIGEIVFSGSVEQMLDSFVTQKLFLEKSNGMWFFN